MIVSVKGQSTGDSKKATRVENITFYLPTEIWLSIFSFLPPNALACCAMVSNRWQDLASAEPIWKSLFLQNYGQSNFSSVGPFIQEKNLLWKQVYSIFFKIASFINKLNGLITGASMLAKAKESARLAGNSQWFATSVPPFVLTEKLGFFSNQSSISVQDLRYQTDYSFTLQGENDDIYVQLAVEKDLLFAYTETGRIVCWNIHTHKMQQLDQQMTQESLDPRFFHVQDGWIVTLNHEQKLKAISIKNLEKVHVCEDTLFNDPSEMLTTSYIFDNKLYLFTSHSLIYILDLKEGKKIDCIKTSLLAQTLMCVKDNKVYFVGNDKIFLVDLHDGSSKEVMHFDTGYRNDPCVMSFFGDHLVIVFKDLSKQWEAKSSITYNFSVIDICSRLMITKNKPIEMGSQENPFNDLINTCLNVMFP